MTGTKIKTITDVRARDEQPKRRKKKRPQSQVPIKFWFSAGVAISIFTFVVQQALPDSRTIDEDSGVMLSSVERKEPVFDFYTLLPESEVVVGGQESEPTTVTVIPEPDPIPAPIVAEEIAPPAPVVSKPEPVKVPVISAMVQVPSESTSPVQSHKVEVAPVPVKPTPAVVTSPPVAGKMHYLLQVGSFRTLGDADKLRSSLLLQGFQPRIESVQVRANEEWHRVQLGPFAAEDEVQTVRTALNEQGIDSMLVRKKL